MKKSIDRILTTHVGSLPRSAELSQLLIDQERKNLESPEHLTQEIEKAMERVIAQQHLAGVDIGNDGEQSRVGFQTQISQRIQGFSGEMIWVRMSVTKLRKNKSYSSNRYY